MRPEVRSLRRAMSNSSQYVSLCKHSNFYVFVRYQLSFPPEEEDSPSSSSSSQPKESMRRAFSG